MVEQKSKISAWARAKSALPVVLLSVLAMEGSFLAGRAFKAWEPAFNDLFMRWRYRLTSEHERLVHPDVAAVAIDSSTQEKFGRFGAGVWLTRRPFIDHMIFLDKYVKPSVIAYDIIFEDPLGRYTGRVTESDRKLDLILKQLGVVKSRPGYLAHPVILGYMNRLSMEQGTSWMASELSKLTMPVVLGYYYRGGWMDSGGANTLAWEGKDLYGDDEGNGMRIPYLTDSRIPNPDVHLVANSMSDPHWFARNAKLPASETLDYSVLGFVNCPRDVDGVVRRVPLIAGFSYRDSKTGKDEVVFTPSLALLPVLIHWGVAFPLDPGTVEVFFGKEIVIRLPSGEKKYIPINSQGQLTLNFKTAFNDCNLVNFTDTAPHSGESQEKVAKLAAAATGGLNGRIVVVGITATGVDSGPTPLSTKTPFMHVHLTAIDNILSGKYLVETSGREKAILYLLVWLVVTTVCCVEKSARLGPTALLLACGYFIGAFVSIYSSIRIVPLMTPLFYIGLCSFSVMTYRFFTEEKAKRKIRGMFSTMVSDKVLEFLEQNPGSFSLKGHNADVSVLFSDVGGFTSISEELAPERLTALINRYFTAVTECIMSNGGYLDKYVGDGVMAVWGAPFPDDKHAIKTCRAALEQTRLLKELNPELKAEFGIELTMRIGINSGVAIAGNMGSSRKFQYTVMGDTVNLAARLEPANKDFGTAIIIGPKTKKSVEGELVTRLLTRIVVKGKTEALPIYELIGEASSLTDEDRTVMQLYDRAMNSFLERRWEEASTLLDELLKIRADDGPALFLHSQIRLLSDSPPAEEWRGEYVRVDKD